MYPDPQRVADITSIRDAMRQISQEAEAVVELLDMRIEDEHLDGTTEAEDVRSVLEVIQTLTLEISEDIDAYQQRHSEP
jgi:ferric-dicitrate binding protein FerR (iron transport regulator)